MRILTIASGGRTSNGALLVAMQSAYGLAARGHQVTLLTPLGGFVDRTIDRNRVAVVNSSLDRWPLKELSRVRDWIGENEIGVVHTHASRSSAFGALLRLLYGVPVVATAHANKIQLHWCCNDHVIAVSDATRRFHMRYNLVSPRRITTVLNASDTSRFEPLNAAERQRVRESLFAQSPTPVPVDAPLLGIVGNIIKRKGHIHAITAMSLITRRFPEARLVIIGRGIEAEVQPLRQVAIDLGVADHLIWTGFRDDVPRLMAAMDLVLCPSLDEPFGLAAPESLACQTPVIATRVGGFVTTIQDGESGFLVPPRNPPALAEAVIQLLRNPELRSRFGLAGRKWVIDQMSPTSHFAQLESIYHRVIDGAAADTPSRSGRAAA